MGPDSSELFQDSPYFFDYLDAMDEAAGTKKRGPLDDIELDAPPAKRTKLGLDNLPAAQEKRVTTITIETLLENQLFTDFRSKVDFPTTQHLDHTVKIEWNQVVATDDEMRIFQNFLKSEQVERRILFEAQHPKLLAEDKPLELSNGQVLSPMEIKALQLYTTNNCMFFYIPLSTEKRTTGENRLDAFMKENAVKNATPEEVKQLAKNATIVASSALNKLPDFEGIIYRGTTEKKAKIEELYGEGSIIYERFFSSYTKNLDIAKDFAARSSYKSHETPIIFEIKSRTGKDISPISLTENEGEVLYPPGKVFRSLGYERVDLMQLSKDKENGAETFEAFVVYLEEMELITKTEV